MRQIPTGATAPGTNADRGCNDRDVIIRCLLSHVTGQVALVQSKAQKAGANEQEPAEEYGATILEAVGKPAPEGCKGRSDILRRNRRADRNTRNRSKNQAVILLAILLLLVFPRIETR
jgi:hypothetical protein